MIELRIIPVAGGGATLHLAGERSWAALEMDRAQLEALHQAAAHALRQPTAAAASLAEFMERLP